MSHPVPLDPTTDVTSEVKLNHLCEKCSRIAHHVSTLQKSCSTDRDNPTIHLINHHESSNALITSAHAGCHLCTLLLAEIEIPMMEDMQALQAELGIKDKLADKLAQPIYQIKLCGYLDERRFSRKRDKFRTAMKPFKHSTFEWRGFDRLVSIDIVLPHEVTRHEAAGDIHIWTYTTARLFIEHQTAGDSANLDRQNPSTSTASPSSFAMARWWLRDCKEHHPGCRREHLSVASNALPTRLVDVGSLDGPATCRLFLSDQPSNRVEYLTLSHKWGGASIYKLTKATFESMLQEISLENLPLTFQHAIVITRNLGYRYVWIDSLCIIQDDVDDWAFESSTMSRIYSNSVLTIAALWGDNSYSGCFVERNPLTTENCRIGEWRHGEVLVRSGDRERGQSLALVKPTPLLERAWVLQERFLSPRTLYYGPWELLWECGERSVSETKPENTETFWDDATIKKRFREMKRPPDLDLNNSYQKPELQSIYDIWTDIRASYWSSRLTHHSDLLVAISGITTWIERKAGMHFVSGLCKEFLFGELLWKVSNGDRTSRSTLSPTWSWASVKGAKLTSLYRSSMYSKTSTFHTWLESIDDSFGMNASPQQNGLYLRGPLLPATLERNKYGHFEAKNSRLPKHGYEPDIPLPATINVVCLVIVGWDKKYTEEIDPDKGLPGYAGLMLVSNVCEASTYERVGVWSHERYTGLDDLKVTPADMQPFRLV